DPATIGERQTLYVSCLALSLAATGLALLLGELTARGSLGEGLRRHRWAITGVSLLVTSVLIYLAMPPFTDPINIPQSIVDDFRWRSLLGLALFWSIFGVALSWLLGRSGTQPEAVAKRRFGTAS